MSRTLLPRLPLWVRTLAGLGVAWNVYGVIQFQSTVFATAEDLMAQGMTAAQATVYSGVPIWMDIAFALGVFGGLVGTILLLLGRREAVPVLAASLAGYLVLYVGDITEGVFAAMGLSQVVVLTVVVLIAAGLLVLARLFADPVAPASPSR
jgi:hypothetical protein